MSKCFPCIKRVIEIDIALALFWTGALALAWAATTVRVRLFLWLNDQKGQVALEPLSLIMSESPFILFFLRTIYEMVINTKQRAASRVLLFGSAPSSVMVFRGCCSCYMWNILTIFDSYWESSFCYLISTSCFSKQESSLDLMHKLIFFDWSFINFNITSYMEYLVVERLM